MSRNDSTRSGGSYAEGAACLLRPSRSEVRAKNALCNVVHSIDTVK